MQVILAFTSGQGELYTDPPVRSKIAKDLKELREFDTLPSRNERRDTNDDGHPYVEGCKTGKRMRMNVTIEESWKRVLKDEFSSLYFRNLVAFVKSAYANGIVYPPGRYIFEAFNRTPFEKVKVVILGQDPYHEPNQAHGLCFSVRKGVHLPPSLLNIYKELESEFGGNFLDRDGDLSHWADQGVLLLNATLTVAAGNAGSHQGKGWEMFTDAVVSKLAEQRENIVFMLWGSYARRKGAVIDRKRHLVLECAHPSPLSAYRGFFGCGHFRTANEYLESNGITAVNW